MLKEIYSWQGRIGRGKFILVQTIFSIIWLIAYLLVNKLPLLSLLLFVFVFFACLFSIIKRFHDLDKSGFIGALVLLVPIVNIYYSFLLLFVKGTEGSNKYGEDPLGK